MELLESDQSDQIIKEDISLSFDEVGGFSLPIVFYILFFFTLIFASIHGFGVLVSGWSVKLLLLLIIPVFLIGVVLHEFIHGICFSLFSGKPLSFIKYGFDRKSLTPYAHCKEPIRSGAYKIGALMPAIILGLIPYVISIINGSFYLFLFGTFFTTAACGDFLVLWLIRNLNRNAMVEDHPSRAGCYVYITEEIPFVPDRSINLQKALKLQNIYKIPFLVIILSAGVVFGYRLVSSVMEIL
ncbi:DUF3267 domain-containing protein [Chondrinema litorale]|uniref:DUF3267 domain-containing protein n=1 Tax=Chondrinema litorale TaxID=2994555 RepID=UPI002543B602|nr:DUF3267 domain-containing protein [Chondrinema litorale]UZR96057.1 DUF3267 domain-containing protein [Chondrinema litorale]